MKKVSLFFLSVFSCSVVAINAFGTLRNVTLGEAGEFYTLCTGKTTDDCGELRECESERSNTAGITDPQIFRFDDYVVKISTKRAPTEIEGTRRALHQLTGKTKLDNFSIFVASKVAIFAEGEELRPQDIFEFDTSLIRGQSVLQLMPMAQGERLHSFLTHNFSELVFAQLGLAIGSMNAMGLHNNDLHGHNIIVSTVDPEKPTISFIDFERAKCSIERSNFEFSSDCAKTFRDVLRWYFFLPILANPSAFDVKNCMVGRCLKSFLTNYCKAVPEVSLRGLIDAQTYTGGFLDYFCQKENFNRWNDVEFVDQRMLATCKMLAEFRECIQKKDLIPCDMFDLIRNLASGEEYDEPVYYSHTIRDLLSAMFFKFTPDNIFRFLDTLGISKEKEWVGYIPTIMGI
ncbi:MAG: lipopolysaccharide kinase InaA family protein [Holosporaceae bacterium]|jgi:hypothetical protein|nr:lipopolysaccharide kinase InaA family protein [Holosporaceae bacterium]